MVVCHEICDLMSPWLDRETTPEVSAHVEAHLGKCAACRAEADEMRAFGALLDLEVDPADLEERVLSSIGERWPMWWWLRTAAAVLISIGLGFSAGGAFGSRMRLVAQVDDGPSVLAMLDDHFGVEGLDGFDELAEDLERGVGQ